MSTFNLPSSARGGLRLLTKEGLAGILPVNTTPGAFLHRGALGIVKKGEIGDQIPGKASSHADSPSPRAEKIGLLSPDLTSLQNSLKIEKDSAESYGNSPIVDDISNDSEVSIQEIEPPSPQMTSTYAKGPKIGMIMETPELRLEDTPSASPARKWSEENELTKEEYREKEMENGDRRTAQKERSTAEEGSPAEKQQRIADGAGGRYASATLGRLVAAEAVSVQNRIAEWEQRAGGGGGPGGYAAGDSGGDASLRATYNEVPGELEAPRAKVTLQVSVTPKVAVTPKSEVSPKKEATPKVAVTPKSEVSPKKEATPNVAVTPKSEVSPKKEATPKVAVTPKSEVSSEKEATPKVAVTPKSEVSSEKEATPKVAVTPKSEVSSEKEATPKVAVTPKSEVTLKKEATPRLELSPKRETAATLPSPEAAAESEAEALLSEQPGQAGEASNDGIAGAADDGDEYPPLVVDLSPPPGAVGVGVGVGGGLEQHAQRNVVREALAHLRSPGYVSPPKQRSPEADAAAGGAGAGGRFKWVTGRRRRGRGADGGEDALLAAREVSVVAHSTSSPGLLSPKGHQAQVSPTGRQPPPPKTWSDVAGEGRADAARDPPRGQGSPGGGRRGRRRNRGRHKAKQQPQQQDTAAPGGAPDAAKRREHDRLQRARGTLEVQGQLESQGQRRAKKTPSARRKTTMHTVIRK